jgi:hypothetical protein
VALRRAAQDDTPQELALAMAGQGEAMLRKGDTAAGVERLRAAHATLRATLPDGHPDTARVQAALDSSASR